MNKNEMWDLYESQNQTVKIQTIRAEASQFKFDSSKPLNNSKNVTYKKEWID